MKSLRFAAPVFALAMLGSTRAFAGDTAAAQALFSDARTLMAAGNYTEACPKLDESEKLDPGMGTLYNLGDCYEHVGKTASAWAAFDEVANEARAAGQPAREQDARARANALSPQLAHLTIDTSAIRGVAGLKITRDGDNIGAPEWDTAVPIDPGEHTVTATAAGKRQWSAHVNVSPHQGASIKVPLLENAPVVVSPPAPFYEFGSNPETSSDGKAQRTVGIALTGVGVLALGTGLVVGVISKNEERAANRDGCNEVSDMCTNQHAIDERSAALTEGNVAGGLAIGGLAVALGGIVVWATAPSAPKKTTNAFRVAPDVAVGQNGASFAMRGSW